MTTQPERSLRPVEGIRLIDKIAAAFDQRERAQAQAPDTMHQMMQAMTMAMQLQTNALAILAQRLAKTEGSKR